MSVIRIFQNSIDVAYVNFDSVLISTKPLDKLIIKWYG